MANITAGMKQTKKRENHSSNVRISVCTFIIYELKLNDILSHFACKQYFAFNVGQLLFQKCAIFTHLGVE